jgi:hypothetical protein
MLVGSDALEQQFGADLHDPRFAERADLAEAGGSIRGHAGHQHDQLLIIVGAQRQFAHLRASDCGVAGGRAQFDRRCRLAFGTPAPLASRTEPSIVLDTSWAWSIVPRANKDSDSVIFFITSPNCCRRVAHA